MASVQTRKRLHHAETRRQPRRTRRSSRRDRDSRKRQQARARRMRREIQAIEQKAPSALRRVAQVLGSAFTRPTYYRIVVLLLAAILTVGTHTVLNMLRTVSALNVGHASSFHRVFSRSPWSMWRLGRCLARWLVEHFVPEGLISLVGDETVDGHRGKKVFGKGRHRDAVRSSHSYTAFRYGHKWVVLAVLIRFPFARRPWALPVLVALYRSKDSSKRRHKTPSQLMRQLLKVLLHWFPDRSFVFAGDGGYGTHELARTAARRRMPQRLILVSRFYRDANLYARPATTARRSAGRPRKKGKKLPTPERVVAHTQRLQRLKVGWYGGGQRNVEVVSGTGHWYKASEGLVEVLWVFVRDLTGTHREEYFFTTDVGLTPKQVIECFTGRWSIETTFQEVRAYLGLETTRGWKKETVLRVAPCLFGLYTIVAALYAQMPARHRSARLIHWIGKTDTTFSDAITAVRRWLWQEWIFAIPGHTAAFAKLGRPLRELLLAGLAPAA
jgi:DDE superfamily endonuclease